MFDFSKPHLRSLEIRQHQQAGRLYFRLRDPQQISNQVLLVPQSLGMLLALCDGTRTPAQLVTEFAAHSGVTIPLTALNELLGALDEAHMLENARTAQARVQALTAYRQAPFRPPTLAGGSYPANAGQLWQLLQDYLEGTEEITALTPDWSQPLGLLSPHIDYPRGGAVYAQVWKRAAQVAREADLVVIFGTDHHGNDPFTLTRQHYATPYGRLPTAQALVNRLACVIGEEAAFAGELRHRTEHSLELVMVWLHHMRNGTPVEVVPLLVGGFQHFLSNGVVPTQDTQIEQVVGEIQRHCAGRRVLVIASGDLAHVGPAFSGPPLDPASRQRLAEADQELIAHMQVGDPEKFFTAIKAVGDRYNICGLVPIYLTLRTLGAVQGTPLGYATCPADEHNTSAVTVCGMMFQ